MNRRSTALAFACLGVISLLASCDELGDVVGNVRGSGNLITEERPAIDFDEIVVLGSGDVTVSVTGNDSLMIEAEDNIMPLLTTEVRGGRLELGSRSSFSTTRGIKYTITVVTLEGIEINGSGDVAATGIDTGSFAVRVSGSGNVEAVGVTGNLDVGISGSGNYAGTDLAAQTGTIEISGSGTAVVNVTDDLRASVSGSGRIEYLGDPALDASTSGSGAISRR